jgi:SAM-dependent methyltransferase
MSQSNNLTDKKFWEKYWQNYQYTKIPNQVFFEKYIPEVPTATKAIEIGGFPGTMSIFFHKKYGFDVSLLDFYIDLSIVNNLEQHNGLAPNTIHCIEHDFFSYQSDLKYDLVYSIGFIEHFEDTGDVIKRHIELLSENGELLIVLPNLLGINGFIQKRFDRHNFDAHNLKSMNLDFLRETMSQLPVTDVNIDYVGKPMVWLEPDVSRNGKVKRMAVKTLSYLIKLFPIKCRFLSPYIIIRAKKK